MNPGCIYQCINGVAHLISGNCPIVPCAQTIQGCDSLDEVYTMPCPRPYGTGCGPCQKSDTPFEGTAA